MTRRSWYTLIALGVVVATLVAWLVISGTALGIVHLVGGLPEECDEAEARRLVLESAMYAERRGWEDDYGWVIYIDSGEYQIAARADGGCQLIEVPRTR